MNIIIIIIIKYKESHGIMEIQPLPLFSRVGGKTLHIIIYNNLDMIESFAKKIKETRKTPRIG